MNLENKINDDLRRAMRAKDGLLKSVLRLLKTALANKEISLRQAGIAELTDEDVRAVIKSEIKKRLDSFTAYKEGNRQDLAEQEKKEAEILKLYLPEQMSEEEINKVVKDVIESIGEVSEKDFGKIIGQVMAKLKGQADGSLVSGIIKKVLAEKK
ncbi:MAG: GatB/YqeY domain-containing protein [Patescibacteria group bacterium]